MIGDQNIAAGFDELFLNRWRVTVHSDDTEIRLLADDACECFAQQAVFDEQEELESASRAIVLRLFHSAQTHCQLEHLGPLCSLRPKYLRRRYDVTSRWCAGQSTRCQ